MAHLPPWGNSPSFWWWTGWGCRSGSPNLDGELKADVYCSVLSPGLVSTLWVADSLGSSTNALRPKWCCWQLWWWWWWETRCWPPCPFCHGLPKTGHEQHVFFAKWNCCWKDRIPNYIHLLWTGFRANAHEQLSSGQRTPIRRTASSSGQTACCFALRPLADVFCVNQH